MKEDRFISPLTWPGGKAKKWKLIKSYFPKETENLTYIEPFFGGGSVGLNSLRDELFKEYIFKDSNTNLMCFWQNIAAISENLKEELFWPNIGLKHLKQEIDKMLIDDCPCCDTLEDESQGLELLVNNNLNFNGSLNGTWSQKRLEQNWNQNKFIRLKKCADLIKSNLYKISFEIQDFFEKPISCSNKTFYYLDPPYYDVDIHLYGTKFTEKGWKSFLKKLNNINNNGSLFCLSINDCPETRAMFTKFNIYEEEWKYTSSNTKNSPVKIGKELIITNYKNEGESEWKMYLDS